MISMLIYGVMLASLLCIAYFGGQDQEVAVIAVCSVVAVVSFLVMIVLFRRLRIMQLQFLIIPNHASTSGVVMGLTG